MTKMIKKGDTIGIIALSGVVDKEKIDNSVRYFENLGYKVKLSKNISDAKRYFAGTDEDKINELHTFFKDKDIKLIMNARGGYGSIRLINKINYNIIRKNPKFFCGYSDITALLLMFYKKCGLTCYHSPMASGDFGAEQVNAFTEEYFWKAVNGDKLKFIGTTIYKKGKVSGILWGGNLSTVVSLCGQNFIPKKNFIFFAEDLNEPVYKIDKMFQQLINIKSFKRYCKAFVLGDFLDSDEYALQELYKEFAEKLKIPIVSGFKITHGKEKITLPIGKQVILDNEVLFV